MDKRFKIFLIVLLIIFVGFIASKIEITGNVPLVSYGDYPTELYLNSDPDGAIIYLGGTYVGQTPLVLTSLEPKEYEVLLKKAGYYDLKEKVSLEIGKRKELDLELTKIGFGNLIINSNVDGADVYINNELRGITLKKISLKEGIYDILVSKNNYADFFTVKAIKAGQKETLFAKLSKGDSGLFYVETTPENAKIFVDGAYRGVTPSSLRLETGKHDLSIEKAGYEGKRLEINSEKNIRKEIILELEQSLGTLLVVSDPVGANIYIDGEYKGTSPKIITGLNDGSHSLKLSKEYYEDYFGTVNIKKVHPNNVFLTLERK